MGYLPAEIAVEILSEHEWGLLPINSEILKFAFPSKSSAYAAAGCKILAICDRDSCLARWVNEGNKGVTSQPVIENVVKKLFEIERGECLSANAADEINRSDYSIETFAKIAKKLLTL